MKWFEYFKFAVLGYLCGSILFGYLFPKFFCRVNVFEQSKDQNPGTANAFLYGNFFCGSLTLIFDLCKGFMPVFLANRFLGSKDLAFLLVMVAPVLGHAFPLFNGFSGGKAIAVSFGVTLGLAPNYLPLFLLCLFYLIFSLLIKIQPHKNRSIFTYFFFSVVCAVCDPLSTTALGCILLSIIVIIKHVMKYNEKSDLKKEEKQSVTV